MAKIQLKKNWAGYPPRKIVSVSAARAKYLVADIKVARYTTGQIALNKAKAKEKAKAKADAKAKTEAETKTEAAKEKKAADDKAKAEEEALNKAKAAASKDEGKS